MAKKDSEFQEYLDHFSPGISDKIKTFAIEKVFKHSRYIFTRREGKRQYGFCTYCRKEYQTSGLKHNTETQCPECMSICTVKASGRGRSKLVDEAYFVYYEKSVQNPTAIVARGIHAVRDYSGWNYGSIETQYQERAWYIFEMGKSVMLSQHGYYSSDKTMHTYSFGKCKSVFSLYGHFHNKQNFVVFTSRESIKEAVKNTPFRFSTWDSYNYKDMVKFFDFYAKYPCIEYLTKLGMRELVAAKLDDERTYSAINWNGKDLFKVLRMTKREFNEIKQQKINVTFFFLKVLQMSKKNRWNLSLPEAVELADCYGPHNVEDLQKLLIYGPIKKIMTYLNKQSKFKDPKQALITWRDYISDCKKLNMDLALESVIFPRNLHRAHQNTIKQIKIKANEEINRKIADRLKDLHKKYYFEYKELLIRPAQSSNELIAEGKALEHCVGTYANQYARGDNILLFIRKISEPDKPYFTMEIRGNDVMQCRGLKNCIPGELVKEFVDTFKSEKLKVNKPRTKTRIPA